MRGLFEMTGKDSVSFWSIVGVVILLVIVYFLAPVIVPFALGIILAYILNPLVKRMKKIGFPRWFSILFIFIVGLVLVLLFLGFLIPLLERQVWLLFNNIPKVLTWVQTKFNLQFDPLALKQTLLHHLQSNGDIAKSIWAAFMSSSTVLIETVINLVLIPVVAIYLLRDWEKFTASCIELFPRRKKDLLIKIFTQCGRVLAAFFRGQLLVMIGLGIIYSIGLSIVGLDLSLVIGIGAGILSVVPYLGFVVGFVVSLIDVAVKYHSWLYVLYICIVFAIGHVAESYVLQPWLIGHRIGLHPVAVIFAVIAGGILFGFVGVLLALPVAAVIVVLLRFFRDHYMRTDYYLVEEDQQ